MSGKCSIPAKFIACAVLVIIIIAALTAYSYSSTKDKMAQNLELGLESTAGVMATQINASEIEGLKPGDELNPQYMAVVNKLRTMRSMNDHIVNAYIMHVNPDQTITFIVDDLYPDDPQGSAKIGEVYTTPDRAEIFAALSGPSASKQPYTDKYGSFVSAYAPIDDSAAGSNGNTTAVLGIDVSAKDFTTYTHGEGYPIIATGIVSMILAAGAILYFGMKLRKAEEECRPGTK